MTSLIEQNSVNDLITVTSNVNNPNNRLVRANCSFSSVPFVHSRMRFESTRLVLQQDFLENQRHKEQV